MKIENYQFPESSFLSMNKDFGLITQKILANEKLKKLLFYSDKNCVSLPNLTEEQSYGLLNNQIKIVPKVTVDQSLTSYIIIGADNFTPNIKNPYYRDNFLTFDIICHFDQWNLGDFRLRPYEIAGELDSMFNEKHLTGIGVLNFVNAEQIILNEEFAGLTLVYKAVHGKEDKV